MSEGPEGAVRSWIETFQAQTRWDLLPLWCVQSPCGDSVSAVDDPWGACHRPDWHQRGLLSWPRGGRWLNLRLELVCPKSWQATQRGDRRARLALCWWADAAELWAGGALVHQGDLFDSACRWPLPASWWEGEPLQLELRLRSPLHDDGALIHSRVDQEPTALEDPSGVLAADALALAVSRLAPEAAAALLPQLEQGAVSSVLEQCAALRPSGRFHVLGHAHLDLAWLWPVADTWQAALRTFESALALMERDPALHFAHSTPALYAWIEQHHPALFARLLAAMEQGRFEPINGPWVESDCVLVGVPSLLRQFEEGQAYSRSRFPQWTHELCWLPDSFGFAAGLPAVAQLSGVRWFCTHKLAWNSSNAFPHRLFRWRSADGSELLSLATAPIGTGGDPQAMETYRQQWRAATGVDEALWLPGVGDHGGGPTAEMLEQLALWQHQPVACPQQHGTLRSYLEGLEPLASRLPVWRDELYLELHRGCATTRPDQKRHNRTLERLLRELDWVSALQHLSGVDQVGADWRPLLFQQFHDILPGTSIPEVFEQAEPQWRQARRQAALLRDRCLQALLPARSGAQPWWLVQLQPQPAEPLTVRLPAGSWRLEGAPLPSQARSSGGTWVQLPLPAGLQALPLERDDGLPGSAAAITNPVVLEANASNWRLANGLVAVEIGAEGVQQLWGADGLPQLSGPMQWRRWRDQGEFWDAWDIAADYREHPLPLTWEGTPELVEQGPLCCRFVVRGCCGQSPLRLDIQLRAASPYLELTLMVDWCQRHELLRLELPLGQAALRYAADTSAGVLERPTQPMTPREEARWEVTAISWVATQPQAGGSGLAVLLDGPQGVSASPERLGVSLLRAPTWPDPSADNGIQRLRLALAPCQDGWRSAGAPRLAQRFREPLWVRPAQRRAENTAGSLDAASPIDLMEGIDWANAQIRLLSCRPGSGPRQLALRLQSLSPQRQSWGLGSSWRWRHDECQGWQSGAVALKPWQLLALELERA